jgi:hypothetical protein
MHSTVKLALAEQFDAHGRILFRHTMSNPYQILVQVSTWEYGVIHAFNKFFPGGRLSNSYKTGSSKGTKGGIFQVEYTFDKAIWVLRTLQKYSVAHTSVMTCALALAEVKLTRDKCGLYSEENREKLQALRLEMEALMRAQKAVIPIEGIQVQHLSEESSRKEP